jgi:CheY-like chemotaxis protein
MRPATIAAPGRARRGRRADTRTPRGSVTGVLDGVDALVVENDAASAKLHALLLRQAGARVRVVHSAEESIDALEVGIPRLILLDLLLPGMSGFALLEALAPRPFTLLGMVVIAVTCLTARESRERAAEAGCAGFIKKPIDVETFALAVARILAGGP